MPRGRQERGRRVRSGAGRPTLGRSDTDAVGALNALDAAGATSAALTTVRGIPRKGLRDLAARCADHRSLSGERVAGRKPRSLRCTISLEQPEGQRLWPKRMGSKGAWPYAEILTRHEGRSL